MKRRKKRTDRTDRLDPSCRAVLLTLDRPGLFWLSEVRKRAGLTDAEVLRSVEFMRRDYTDGWVWYEENDDGELVINRTERGRRMRELLLKRQRRVAG